MRRGPEYQCNDERLEAPWIGIDTWIELDQNKKDNRGWVVIENPDLKKLKELVANKFFEAVEIDECPVRFRFDGVQQNYPCGLSVAQVKSLIYKAEHK